MSEEEARKHRLTNKKKSKAAELAWKRNHQSYMTGTRKRERNMENKTLYSLAQDLDTRVSKDENLNEESIVKENPFDQESKFSFNTIAGSICMLINDGKVSFSCGLDETGSGSYGLENGNVEQFYKDLSQDLQMICDMVDKEMQQVLAKYGLKSTK